MQTKNFYVFAISKVHDGGELVSIPSFLSSSLRIQIEAKTKWKGQK
jgi:hypothetical protein